MNTLSLIVLVEDEFKLKVMSLFIYIVLWRVTNQDGFQCKVNNECYITLP